jgi:hypothetical protein
LSLLPSSLEYLGGGGGGDELASGVTSGLAAKTRDVNRSCSSVYRKLTVRRPRD